MNLGPAEIFVILVVALLVFGPKRLPEVGKQVGGALREFRKMQDTVKTEIQSAIDDVDPRTALRDSSPPSLAPRPTPSVSDLDHPETDDLTDDLAHDLTDDPTGDEAGDLHATPGPIAPAAAALEADEADQSDQSDALGTNDEPATSREPQPGSGPSGSFS